MIAYKYDVSLEAVLDLTDESTLGHLRVGVGELVSRDRSLTREIGDRARSSGLYQAILSH